MADQQERRAAEGPAELVTEAGRALLALARERGKHSASGWDAIWAEQDAWDRAADEIEESLPAIEQEAYERGRREALDALESMVRQFGYWSDTVGGMGTGGLSDLEDAFVVLGWRDDPHPIPDMCCDEPGCKRQATIGWPTRPGGTGPNGGYRRTCHEHWCGNNPGSCKSHPDGAR